MRCPFGPSGSSLVKPRGQALYNGWGSKVGGFSGFRGSRANWRDKLPLRRPKVAVACSGGGFPELGANLAGFDVFWQCEKDPACLEVLNYHWPESIKEKDLRQVEALPDDHIDCFYMGFPCTNISAAGNREGVYGTESSLLFEGERLLQKRVDDGQPIEYVVLENVSALKNSNGGESPAIVEILNMFKRLGYKSVAFRKIAASSHGLPLDRVRFYIVASFHGNAAHVLLPSDGLYDCSGCPLGRSNCSYCFAIDLESRSSDLHVTYADIVDDVRSKLGVEQAPCFKASHCRYVLSTATHGSKELTIPAVCSLLGAGPDFLDCLGLGRKRAAYRIVGNATDVPTAYWIFQGIMGSMNRCYSPEHAKTACIDDLIEHLGGDCWKANPEDPSPSLFKYDKDTFPDAGFVFDGCGAFAVLEVSMYPVRAPFIPLSEFLDFSLLPDCDQEAAAQMLNKSLMHGNARSETLKYRIYGYPSDYTELLAQIGRPTLVPVKLTGDLHEWWWPAVVRDTSAILLPLDFSGTSRLRSSGEIDDWCIELERSDVLNYKDLKDVGSEFLTRTKSYLMETSGHESGIARAFAVAIEQYHELCSLHDGVYAPGEIVRIVSSKLASSIRSYRENAAEIRCNKCSGCKSSRNRDCLRMNQHCSYLAGHRGAALSVQGKDLKKAKLVFMYGGELVSGVVSAYDANETCHIIAGNKYYLWHPKALFDPGQTAGPAAKRRQAVHDAVASGKRPKIAINSLVQNTIFSDLQQACSGGFYYGSLLDNRYLPLLKRGAGCPACVPAWFGLRGMLKGGCMAAVNSYTDQIYEHLRLAFFEIKKLKKVAPSDILWVDTSFVAPEGCSDDVSAAFPLIGFDPGQRVDVRRAVVVDLWPFKKLSKKQRLDVRERLFQLIVLAEGRSRVAGVGGYNVKYLLNNEWSEAEVRVVG